MKKLVLLLAVMFSMTFVSCTGNADKTATLNDSIDTTQVDSVQVDSIDSVAIDTTVVDSVK